MSPHQDWHENDKHEEMDSELKEQQLDEVVGGKEVVDLERRRPRAIAKEPFDPRHRA